MGVLCLHYIINGFNLVSGKDISDLFYGMALFVNAALFLPQAYKIYKKKHAMDVSLITFGGFNIIQALGLINGIYNSDYALIFGQFVSLVACGLVTIQIITYKIKYGSNYKLGKNQP